jgi:hypothetical protein
MSIDYSYPKRYEARKIRKRIYLISEDKVLLSEYGLSPCDKKWLADMIRWLRKDKPYTKGAKVRYTKGRSLVDIKGYIRAGPET